MPTSTLRLALLTVVWLAAGCSGDPVWPVPKNTTDIVLQRTRRDVITTVNLGDALHLVLPSPLHPGTQWQILALSTVNLRQMTDLKPVPESPGSEEISFQAIKTTARTLVRFAAVDPKVSASKPDDFFAVLVGIKMPVRSASPLVR